MLIVLSPAKTLNYETPAPTDQFTIPRFMDMSAELIDVLRAYSPNQISKLMSISDALAALNVSRYATWSRACTVESAKQAIFAFDGDVYNGLKAETLSLTDVAYAQDHLRILSGLYGVLRPLDLLQPYRLEFGTRLSNPKGSNLYEFWSEVVTQSLNADLEGRDGEFVYNLASNEYAKSILTEKLRATIVSPVFEDWSGGRFKVVSFHAKRARGMMARYAVEKKAGTPEDLLDFDADGYRLDAQVSTVQRPVFRRRNAQ
jgi:hypothetical protein